ncbi:MAG TPA: carboxylesterase family protein [Bryocella sp.]|nr:carboxylesterase family protein [Bryocella sp.]
MNRRNFLKCAATVAMGANAPHSFAQDDRPIVHTTAGAVRGQVRDGIAVFLGIPYGAETRTTRFQPSLPPAPWNSVRDALLS